MIWSVPEIIACLSRLLTLAAGDLVLAGTPAGVGPLRPVEVRVVALAGFGTLTTPILADPG